MNKIYWFIITVLLLSANVAVSAQQPEKNKEEADKKAEQETLHRQMTLEREYDPAIMDASKINTLPAVREMVIQKRPIVYSDYAIPLHFENEINTLPSGVFMTAVERYADKGYLHLAGGMRMNFNGDFGYHLLSTERDDLRVHFSHRSTNGNVTYIREPFDNVKAKLNENKGGLDFKHTFDDLTLSLGGNVGYSMFNYYGQPTNASIHSAFEHTPNDSATNQANRIINVYAGIASAIPAKLGYHFGVDYTNFDQKYSLSKDYKGITENAVGINFGLNSPFNNDQCFGIDLKFNILNYTMPESAGRYPDSVTFDNRYELTFSPYYKLERDFLKLVLGANFMLVSQYETDFFVSPNIKLDVPVSASNMFYVDLGGGIESNTMNQVSRINRYISPLFPPDASRSWIDGRLGFRSSITPGLWAEIFGGYKYTQSDLFFTPSQNLWIDNGFNNVSLVCQPNSQRFQLGASLKYDYKSVFGFYLKGAYNHYTLVYADYKSNNWKNRVSHIPDNLDIQPYGRPAAVINAGLYAKPLAPLTLNLDYNLLSGISYYYNGKNSELKPVNDLQLRGSWKLNDTFGFYAQFNNLLFQKQELFYGYPLQPFTAMVGLNINF